MNPRGIRCVSKQLQSTAESRLRQKAVPTEHTKSIISSLQGNLNIKTYEKWYSLRDTDIEAHGGKGLLSNFDGSISECLRSVYPEHKFHEWLFTNRPVSKGFWSSLVHRREFVEWFMEEEKLNNLEQWYNVSRRSFISRGGSNSRRQPNACLCRRVANSFVGGAMLTDYYGGSLFKCLKEVFPQHDWKEWKFKTVPRGFWSSHLNQQLFMDWAGKELKVIDLSNWYAVKPRKIRDLGGGSLLHTFHGSLISLLQSVYPLHLWNEWEFDTVPKGFWASQSNQKRYLEWAAHRLNINNPDDWYSITVERLIAIRGAGLLQANRNSLFDSLLANFPEHKWQHWRFSVAPVGSWQNPEQVEQYMQELRKTLGVARLEDWYRVPLANLRKEGATVSLFKDFGELVAYLRQRHPAHEWHEWRFSTVPRGFWESPHNRVQFVDWLARRLNIQQPSDWYGVSYKTIVQHGGKTLLNRFSSSVKEMLCSVYPHHRWADKWVKTRTRQKRLRCK